MTRIVVLMSNRRVLVVCGGRQGQSGGDNGLVRKKHVLEEPGPRRVGMMRCAYAPRSFPSRIAQEPYTRLELGRCSTWTVIGSQVMHSERAHAPALH